MILDIRQDVIAGPANDATNPAVLMAMVKLIPLFTGICHREIERGPRLTNRTQPFSELVKAKFDRFNTILGPVQARHDLLITGAAWYLARTLSPVPHDGILNAPVSLNECAQLARPWLGYDTFSGNRTAYDTSA
jgi:hypothetical protein